MTQKFDIGDIVVLTAGSMRMGVEAVDNDQVACVWCHEGEIGRDNFHVKLLKRWEYREDDSRNSRNSDDRRAGGGKPYRGDREGGGKRHHEGGRSHDGGRNSDGGGRHNDGGRERGGGGRTGWDGKPREKSYYRKDN